MSTQPTVDEMRQAAAQLEAEAIERRRAVEAAEDVEQRQREAEQEQQDRRLVDVYASREAELQHQQAEAFVEFSEALRTSPFGVAWLRYLDVQERRRRLHQVVVNAAARLGMVNAKTGAPTAPGLLARGPERVMDLDVVDELRDALMGVSRQR